MRHKSGRLVVGVESTVVFEGKASKRVREFFGRLIDFLDVEKRCHVESIGKMGAP